MQLYSRILVNLLVKQGKTDQNEPLMGAMGGGSPSASSSCRFGVGGIHSGEARTLCSPWANPPKVGCLLERWCIPHQFGDTALPRCLTMRLL